MLARRLTHSDAGGARLVAELDTRPAPAEAEAFGAALEKRGAAVNVYSTFSLMLAMFAPFARIGTATAGPAGWCDIGAGTAARAARDG